LKQANIKIAQLQKESALIVKKHEEKLALDEKLISNLQSGNNTLSESNSYLFTQVLFYSLILKLLSR